MAYASISGRARTSAKKPQAHAICDRCGFRYNFVDLSWQYDWRGAAVQNLRVLVCKPCTDRPQEQLRAIVLPADPTPIVNARTQDFSISETDLRATSAPVVLDPITGLPVASQDYRVTVDCQNRTTTPYGVPVGLQLNAVMPYNGGVQSQYGVALDVISVTATGGNVISVTCRSPHGLVNGNPDKNQVAVSGLANPQADGFFTVNVVSAMAFTYALYHAIPGGGTSFEADDDTPADSSTPVNIPNGALFTGGSRIWTCKIGLPRNYNVIPQIQQSPGSDQ